MTRIFDFTDAIVRRPGASVVKGLRAGGGADPTLDGVLAEHAGYVAALRSAGLAVQELDPLEDFPDAIFVEDPALVFPEGAVLLRPGAPSREAEGQFLRDVLAARFPVLLEQREGYADGGDVLVMPDFAYIGLSARTDRAGAEALAGLLAELGYSAKVAETPPEVLHLKTASSLIDEETVLATAPLAASGIFAGYRVLVVPEGEDGGANVLRVRDTILVGAGYPRLIELLDGYGARVAALPNAEIAKIDAGFTCMSLRWRAG
ncbi:dimethylarginine dimethylaminohydrolase family protein [Novosphingobium sp. B 225]|uniref:dimethylarginine dimethylaminohydrolase family protein n=1 Tax=Novosphingobium sp. B 225 TaxID=1961849 RepID=UPI000B4AEFB2|nr:arginine deiminase family protein [Novosphingobium sp. B 225]